jgi:hypothetical protein
MIRALILSQYKDVYHTQVNILVQQAVADQIALVYVQKHVNALDHALLVMTMYAHICYGSGHEKYGIYSDAVNLYMSRYGRDVPKVSWIVCTPKSIYTIANSLTAIIDNEHDIVNAIMDQTWLRNINAKGHYDYKSYPTDRYKVEQMVHDLMIPRTLFRTIKVNKLIENATYCSILKLKIWKALTYVLNMYRPANCRPKVIPTFNRALFDLGFQ